MTLDQPGTWHLEINMNPTIVAAACLCAALVSVEAHADTLTPGGNSVGAITRISSGVKELSLEMNVVVKSDTVKGEGQQPDTTTMQLVLMGAPVFRYFIIDNLSLGLHAGGFYKTASDATGDLERETADVGFLGSLTASYHVALGGGMFIAPLIGGGGFFGNREVSNPDPAGSANPLVRRATLAGVAARAGIGLVFYSSPRFNLFARPEAIMYFGSSTPKQEATTSTTVPADTSSGRFTSIDGGFTCGLSYVF